MSEKTFKNADLISNVSHRCYYIRVFGAKGVKADHQECLRFDTPEGDVDIILDKTKDGKVIGIEILDNEA